MKNNDSLLGFALLGLLLEKPKSGYDLRKFFATTAMGSFSDSPGAIYPALSRLERQGLARAIVETSTGLRKRRVFKVTAKGMDAFKGWLRRPVTQDDLIHHGQELMLRFAFMDQTLGADQAVLFLRGYVRELEGHIPSLKAYLDVTAETMPLSARLAFEFGVHQYEAGLRWGRNSIAKYEQRKGNQK